MQFPNPPPTYATSLSLRFFSVCSIIRYQQASPTAHCQSTTTGSGEFPQTQIDKVGGSQTAKRQAKRSSKSHCTRQADGIYRSPTSQIA